MKRSKKNPDLAEVLSQLRDWSVIERKLTEDPGAHKTWRDVEDWAKGTALKYRVELAPPVSPSNAELSRGDGSAAPQILKGN